MIQRSGAEKVFHIQKIGFDSEQELGITLPIFLLGPGRFPIASLGEIVICFELVAVIAENLHDVEECRNVLTLISPGKGHYPKPVRIILQKLDGAVFAEIALVVKIADELEVHPPQIENQKHPYPYGKPGGFYPSLDQKIDRGKGQSHHKRDQPESPHQVGQILAHASNSVGGDVRVEYAGPNGKHCVAGDGEQERESEERAEDDQHHLKQSFLFIRVLDSLKQTFDEERRKKDHREDQKEEDQTRSAEVFHLRNQMIE